MAPQQPVQSPQRAVCGLQLDRQCFEIVLAPDEPWSVLIKRDFDPTISVRYPGNIRVLTPIFVAGQGRCGTTAVMSLLATDSRVAVDRVYPFENRYLTYLANMALLTERQEPENQLSPTELYEFGDSRFGAPPWDFRAANGGPAIGLPSVSDFLPTLWKMFSDRVDQKVPGALFYAEKAPPWMPSLVRQRLRPFTIWLFRDPRDVFLSANAFMRKNHQYGFGRLPGDADLDYARHVTLGFLTYFENYFMDRRRDDCILVRYEDMVQRKQELPARLEQHLSLKLTWDAALAWQERHQTAPDIEHSVKRWRTEPLADDLIRFFDRHVNFEMNHLGYPAGSRSQRRLPSLEFRRGAIDLTRLVHSNDGRLEVEEEHTDVTIRGEDFWIQLPVEPFDAAAVCEIWVSAQPAVGEVCSLYWRGANNEFSEERCCHLSYRPAKHWHVFRFEVSKHPLWNGTITGLRLDLFNSSGSCPAATEHGSIRWIRLVE